MESLDNSNLESLGSDFFFLFFFFLGQAMNQKNGHVHCFAMITPRAGESKVLSRDRGKKGCLGTGTVRREVELCADSFATVCEHHPDVWSIPWSHVGSGSCHLHPFPMALCPRKARAPEMKINKLVFFSPTAERYPSKDFL